MVQADLTNKDYHHFGMGKLVEPPVSTTDQPPNAVILHELAVGNTISSPVKVGQVVSYPKMNLALPL